MNKIILIAFLTSSSCLSIAQTFQEYYTKAREVYGQKNYSLYYDNLHEAHRLHPYYQIVLYRLGIAAALTGKVDESFKYLHQAVLIDAKLPLKDVADLTSIKDLPEFEALLTFQTELLQPVIRSDTAFVIKDRTLHVEGIEYNPVRKEFYLGSIHQRKIIVVNKKGEVEDFCAPAADGITSIFGLKLDLERNLLWACASPTEQMENYDSSSQSAVYKFDLKTRKLIGQYKTENKSEANFGDLLLNKAGIAFITDSKNNVIYQVNENSNRLDVFFTSKEFWNIQGISFSPDEKYLFISDYIKGVFRLDMKTKELMFLPNLAEASLKGIDGLYFYKNSLIAIQNGVTPLRVTRLYLNTSFAQIDRVEVIDRGHPAFNEPTLGTMDGQTLYYIANSQWNGYEKGKQKPASQLQEIVILKTTLD